MHVTITCYKQTSVIRHDTNEHPIFLGPIFIHDNSDFESFGNFFFHLKMKLISKDLSPLIIGTDDEYVTFTLTNMYIFFSFSNCYYYFVKVSDELESLPNSASHCRKGSF